MRKAIRSRTGIVLVVVGLAALGFSGPASAEKAEPAARADAVPADDITGQDHPADVFVQAWQYIPAEVHVTQGQSIKFGNYDMYPYGAGIAAHSMEEAIPGCTQPPYTKCDRYPLFSSALTDHGYVHKVEGVEHLPKGTYQFTCQVHSQMLGTLVVE